MTIQTRHYNAIRCSSFTMDTATMLRSLTSQEQKKASEELKQAFQDDAIQQAQKKHELVELKKIKVDVALVKALAAEFDKPNAEIELLLRKNDNDAAKVTSILVNEPF